MEMALPGPSGASPHPSSTTRQTFFVMELPRARMGSQGMLADWEIPSISNR